MSTRRDFIKQSLGGSAALAASGFFSSGRVLGANDRIRIGLIGGGDRGQEIFKAALQCPNVDGVAVADVYTRRLDEVRQFVPNIKTYRDFRKLLDDKSIDAVLISTPPPRPGHPLPPAAAVPIAPQGSRARPDRSHRRRYRDR